MNYIKQLILSLEFVKSKVGSYKQLYENISSELTGSKAAILRQKEEYRLLSLKYYQSLESISEQLQQIDTLNSKVAKMEIDAKIRREVQNTAADEQDSLFCGRKHGVASVKIKSKKLSQGKKTGKA